jgi:RND family efflux transporter MFP subunit
MAGVLFDRARCARAGAGALLNAALVATLLVLFASCGGGAPAEQEVDAPVVLAPEHLVEVQRQRIEAGPILSGSLEARQRAVLRAEAAGSVSAMAVELGDAVREGQVLARIEDQGQRDAASSAAVALRAAEQDAALAESQAARTRRLVDVGALPRADLEPATLAEAAANARLASARAHLVSSRRQLEGGTLRAPFDGVVSERTVNAGDIVAPGAPMLTLIDPSTMRLQATVSSEHIGSLQAGLEVRFEVRGYPGQRFTGTLDRIAPAADAVTRQVTVLVDIPNPGGRLVAGLFAEGRIVTEAREALVVPFDALLDAATVPAVLVVEGDRLERREVGLGLRDEQEERVEVSAGLEGGELLVVGPARTLRPGTTVQVGTGVASR